LSQADIETLIEDKLHSIQGREGILAEKASLGTPVVTKKIEL
jgi:hypothetical protein